MRTDASVLHRALSRPARDLLSRFRDDRRGNIAIIFGFSLLPLIGCVGLSMDYGRLLSARNTSQTAADAAALYASGAAKTLIQNSDGSDQSIATAIASAKTRAEALFNANAARTAKLSLSGSVTISKTGQRLDAVASYSVSTANAFGTLFGAPTMVTTVTAKSSATLPPYVSVYMSLDVSQSMGLASTNDGAKNLFAAVARSESDNGNPNGGCVFGCHVRGNNNNSPYTYERIAQSIPVQLRIDVLRDAVLKTIDTAKTNASVSNTGNFKIALYTMGLSSSYSTSSGLNELQSLTNDWVALKSAAGTIDLGPNNSGGTGDTFLTEPLDALRVKIPTGGDGTSQNQAQTYLFIITDGLRDVAGNCGYGHCTAAFDPTVCAPYKTLSNTTVAVIYTTYLPILQDPTNGSTALVDSYRDLAAPYVPAIPGNLRTCASPGWYEEASDGPGISAALAQLFARTTQQATLTY